MPTLGPVFDERLPIGLAFAASLIVHGGALVLPGWMHPHPMEPPAPLVVALQPAPPSAAAPPSRPPEDRRESTPPSDPRPPKPAPRAASEAPRRVAPPPTPSAAPAKPPERDVVAARGAAPASPAPPAPATESGERSAPPSPSETTGRPAAPAPAATASAVPSAPPATPPAYGAAYLRNPAPRYPAEARRRGAEGTVMLRVWVAADGSAARVEVDRSSGHQALDDAALAAVKNWRFVPAQRGGAPVEGLVTVPLVFRLDGSG